MNEVFIRRRREIPARRIAWRAFGVPATIVMTALAVLAHGDVAMAQDESNGLQSTSSDSLQRDSEEDRVWLQPAAEGEASRWYPGNIELRRGQVLDFHDRHLRIRFRDEASEQLIAADRVVWIEPARRSALQQRMIDQYRSGEFGQALQNLPDALKERPPVWQQQWLTMVAASAAQRSGRFAIALELVAQLDRRPLPPLVLAELPVSWQRSETARDAWSEAEKRLSDDSPAVQLVAASWLMGSPQRGLAVQTLQEVSRGDRPLLAALARTLLWKSAAPPEVQRSAEEWEQALEALPMALQRGPARLLAGKFQSAGMPQRGERLRWSMELTPIHP